MHEDAVGHIGVGGRDLEIEDGTVVVVVGNRLDHRRLDSPRAVVDEQLHAGTEVGERRVVPGLSADPGPASDIETSGLGHLAGQRQSLDIVGTAGLEPPAVVLRSLQLDAGRLEPASHLGPVR